MTEKERANPIRLTTKGKNILTGLEWTFFGWLSHDFVHQVYQLKGTCFSIEGGYWGILGVILVKIILVWKE